MCVWGGWEWEAITRSVSLSALSTPRPQRPSLLSRRIGLSQLGQLARGEEPQTPRLEISAQLPTAESTKCRW